VAPALETLPSLGARLPDAADRATADLAAAVLASDAVRAEAAVATLEQIETERRAADEAPTGLLPFADDARNALVADARQRREATRALLERDDLDPALRSRLEREVADDPLTLASQRMRDARTGRVARTVNAVVEPVGSSLGNAFLLPWKLAQGVTDAAVSLHQEDALGTEERQALAQWKRFLEEHPDAPEAEALVGRVEASQRRWYRTQRDRTLRATREALERGDPREAAALAERALRYAPEDRAATALRDEARAEAERREAERARSLEAPRDPPEDLGAADARELAVALLRPGGDVAGAARPLMDAGGPLADEGAFALVLAEAERGAEDASWDALAALAEDDAANMARHAHALLTSPEQNPHAAFEAARSAARGDRLRWLFLGPLARGARDRDLPRAAEWGLETLSLPQVVLGFPNRLIRSPFTRSQRRSPGVFARRYLERHPEGEHSAEVRGWLEEFEKGRGNHLAALRVAETAPAPDAGRLARLREAAARQALDATTKETRLDQRIALLRHVAREFPETEAGREAGAAARREIAEATPQRIRVTRGFLREHPEVAGPTGLALRAELLDGERRNGELHPEGISLLGAGAIEVAYVAASGNEDDDPERVRQSISEERLARLVAMLEDSAERTARVDRDYGFEADADRDLFFEQARLGVADAPHPAATSRSSFVYQGVRERYGLVRGRDSILPVELVLHGSLEDLGLGAFPRVRTPRETPDAFLYR
jgi:hypothetical protein